MTRAIIFILGASLALLIVIGKSDIWRSQSNAEEIMSAECGEANRQLIDWALEQVFGDHLKAKDLIDVVCSKTPYTSDLFALARLTATADLSGLKMSQPDDWQQDRIDAAYGQFAEVLPQEGSAISRVTSGFTSSGSSKVVLIDFGNGRRYVYFEL